MNPAIQLAKVISEVRSRLGKLAAGAISVWFAVGVSLVLVVAWMLAESNLWYQGSRIPAFLDMLVILGFSGACLIYYLCMRYLFSDDPLTVVMEQAAGLRSGRLKGSIELGSELPRGVSQVLVNEGSLRVLSGLEKCTPSSLTGEL